MSAAPLTFSFRHNNWWLFKVLVQIVLCFFWRGNSNRIYWSIKIQFLMNDTDEPLLVKSSKYLIRVFISKTSYKSKLNLLLPCFDYGTRHWVTCAVFCATTSNWVRRWIRNVDNFHQQCLWQNSISRTICGERFFLVLPHSRIITSISYW